MTTKTILLVCTGGTIGSAATGGTIDTTDTAPFELLRQFQAHYPDYRSVAFKTIRPLTLLSENLVPADWATLMMAIAAEQPAQFDGIIITHGTDTLSFTAAALSFYFHALATPILLVSSDYPLTDDRANGLANFTCAVDFIRQPSQPSQAGVFVPYQNPQQTMQVHRGNRLAASLQLSGDFFSVQHKSYMQYQAGKFTVLNPLNIAQRAAYALSPQFSGRVLMIKPYPGLDYRTVNLDTADAVLHDLYHSGTACASPTGDGHHALPAFIKRCQAQNVAVYLAPILQSPNAYHSTRLLIEQGAQVLWNLSIEAAYAKLLLAYGNFSRHDDIVAFMSADIAGEHL
jgi:L-asparaginase